MKKKNDIFHEIWIVKIRDDIFRFLQHMKNFQSFINIILHEHLNDIFIYFNSRKKHVVYVFKILQRFKKTNLYFDINKYEFFIKQIKYLHFIITIENVKINSTKINAIINWSTSRKKRSNVFRIRQLLSQIHIRLFKYNKIIYEIN